MLKDIIEKLGYAFVPVENEDKIYKLFSDGTEYEPIDSNDFLYLGVYNANIKKDYAAAETFYKTSIEMGNVAAVTHLGLMYFHKYKNFEKAEMYFKKGWDLGDVAAINGIGLIYWMNDKKKSKIYFKEAISLGHATANYNLARVYDEIKNPNKAEYYYKIAHNKGVAQAAEQLIKLAEKQNRIEDILLFLYPNPNFIQCIPKLFYPILNKDKIYPILETFDPPSDIQVGPDFIKIMQDVIATRQQVLCSIAYNYKNYNKNI